MCKEFSVRCHNCNSEVNTYVNEIRYVLTENGAIQESQTIKLSCGCSIDFADWQLNLQTGQARIVDFTGKVFIEFFDEELLMEEDE
jgi:hypothetical protein